MTLASAAGKLLAGAALLIVTAIPVSAAEKLEPFAASPDQVLVIYNADWKKRSENSSADQDSRDVAEYYAAMHTDPKTGKKPYLLGLGCRHRGKKHLNDWVIREESTDNRNGIIFRGKGPAPSSLDWVRDSRKVEIQIKETDADWNSLSIICRSEATGEKKIVTPLMTALQISGIPSSPGSSASYPPAVKGKGISIRLDATKLFAGTVTISLKARNTSGKVIRDLNLRYYDARDFAFSASGPDGIADDRILSEDVLKPVRTFLEDRKNALPDGTLLKDHLLYIVVVHGMPYSANGAFGIDHGATSNRGDHGSLASLEQRLQTLYYDWESMKPPIIPFHMGGGPDSDQGVINHIITTAMRNQLTGSRWNPYMHPDTYSYLRQGKNVPEFLLLPPLPERRKTDSRLFAYAVSRIDGAGAEEAKRIIDYSLYASRYLRPEMDCRTRGAKRPENAKLPELLSRAEQRNLWGDKELETLGFIVQNNTEHQKDQGLPFMARPAGDAAGDCRNEKADWTKAGFYPGGMERRVISHNGLNNKNAEIWQQIAKGVTVSAAGSPAYGGGPHITNATFWDNRILVRYLFRGRDLGECFLLSTAYVNWSTSLIGDPLFHPDLRNTVIDTTPPIAKGGLAISFDAQPGKVAATVGTELVNDPKTPEVALLRVVFNDGKGGVIAGVSPLYSRRPNAVIEGLRPDTAYTVTASLIDPYGNTTEMQSKPVKSKAVNYPLSIIRRIGEELKTRSQSGR
uniref:Fibronectin type-III domain-containing protein n=1 Tax=Geobacter metallireducens TaxID=28232 RepID=A0A831UEC8_GEOME